PEELEDVKAAVRTATKIPPRLQRMIGGDPSAAFSPTIYVALGFDLREVDSTAARVGYNLSTGLDDRGLMYLRFGPPGKLVLGGDNSADPQCASNELERWRYAEWGEVRFSRPSAFSKAFATRPERVSVPLNNRRLKA